MSNITDIFRCADCGHDRIEEMLVNAVVATEVVAIDSDGHKTYGDTETRDGEVECYQCALCGARVDLDDLIDNDTLTESTDTDG